MYFSTITLLAVSARPRLSLYNLTLDEARQMLASVAPTLDPQAHLVGDSLVLPSLNVQLHVEAFSGLRAVALRPWVRGKAIAAGSCWNMPWLRRSCVQRSSPTRPASALSWWAY